MTPISRQHALRSLRGGARAALIVAGLAVALGACARGPVDPMMTTSIPDDYRVNHPILIDDQVATMDIPVAADTTGLTSAVRSNIGYFAQAFRNSGAGTIAVVAPSGSPNQVAAARIAVEIEALLAGSGISPGAIDYRVYRASPQEKIAPVRIAYNRITATTAPCGPWTDQVANNGPNRNYGAFGCASQQNLAAAIQNPLDLLYPRGLTPPDAARRSAVLEKYRRGERFISATSVSGGSIAQVGQ